MHLPVSPCSMPGPIDYKALFDASANAYMVLDRELRYVAANAAYLELTGASLQDLLGRHVFELFPHDEEQPDNGSSRLLRESFEAVLQTRQRHVVPLLVYRVPRVPGGPAETRLWSASHEPLLDEQGEVAFIVQNTADVTDLARDAAHDLTPEALSRTESVVLRRAAQAAESNRALGLQVATLRNLFEQAPGFVCWLRGPQHIVEMANPAYLQLVGDRDLVGKPIREGLPDVAGQGYFELLDEVTRSGNAFVGTGMRVQLNRPQRGPDEAFIDFVYQPILAPDGTVTGILVQGQDVTQHQRQANRQRFLMQASECLATASQDLEESLRKLAHVAAQGFSDWAVVDLRDERGGFRRLVAWSPKQERTLGERALRYAPSAERDSLLYRARESATSTLIAEFTPEMQRESAYDADHLRLIEETGIHSILVVPLISGSQHFGAITFSLAASPRRYDAADVAIAEELARIGAIALDNNRLSREHTELLQREQAARERAESANQAKDEFLAMLGHELRNPLAPILTAIQLMKLRAEGEPSREEVIIERQANHMVRLVDDLLDVSRIARGKVQLRQAPTDIAHALTRAVEIVSPLLEQEQHRLTVKVPTGLMVFGDEARLSQVMTNLLTNAARYTPAQGSIELRAFAEDHNIVVRVTDNGVGITPELLPRIFDLFVQGPQHSDRAEGGLGLGLTLVRNLVTMHGGTVEARSAGAGRGSVFELRLPELLLSNELATGAPQQPRSSTAQTSAKVLIVDDNTDAADLLAALFEARGHEVAVAYDGPSALQEAERFQPEVAILDIGLPVMDGYELAAQLRAAAAPTPRMIALTGYGSENDRARSMAAGFFAHLVKPVEADLVFSTVNKALNAGPVTARPSE